ncbi:MAG: LysM peptidoglycan-binding domain-containing protein [Bacilli bacterium]|nr:LysM peptidoglycan-binding domain-containing protein [Bacilli bacterium]
MRKIVPFNNVLKFNTSVSEITAISLEHDISKNEDAISGVFYISGEYKIMNGGLEKEKFNFDLPFDVALGSSYLEDSLDVNVDDFRYELIDEDRLKVSIDLYIDGEEVKESIPEEEEIILPKKADIRELDLLDDILDLKDDKEDEKAVSPNDINININNDNVNINAADNNNVSNDNSTSNIFNNFSDNEEFVTYRVYRVDVGDTIDSIMEKYGVTKEELLNYNSNLDEIKVGDKLIIPSK